MLGRKLNDGVAEHDRGRQGEEATVWFGGKCVERPYDFDGIADWCRQRPYAQCPRRRLHRRDVAVVPCGKLGIENDSDTRYARCRLLEQFEPFAGERGLGI